MLLYGRVPCRAGDGLLDYPIVVDDDDDDDDDDGDDSDGGGWRREAIHQSSQSASSFNRRNLRSDGADGTDGTDGTETDGAPENLNFPELSSLVDKLLKAHNHR